MICNKCKNELSGYEKFCPKCGNTIERYTDKDTTKQSIKSNNYSKKIIISIIIIITILVCSIIIYKLSKSTPPISNNSTTNTDTEKYIGEGLLDIYSNLYYQGTYIEVTKPHTSEKILYSNDGLYEIPRGYLGEFAKLSYETVEINSEIVEQWDPVKCYESNSKIVVPYRVYSKEEVDKYWGITTTKERNRSALDTRPLEEICNVIVTSWNGDITPRYTNEKEYIKMALDIEKEYLTNDRYEELCKMVNSVQSNKSDIGYAKKTGLEKAVIDGKLKEKYISIGITEAKLKSYYYEGTLDKYYNTWEECLKDAQTLNIIITDVSKYGNLTGIEKAIEEGNIGDDYIDNGVSEEWLNSAYSNGNLQEYYNSWEECLNDAKKLNILREPTKEELEMLKNM